RFHYNWLKTDQEDYPRYKVVHPEFDGYWHRFLDFVNAESLGTVTPNQWEVTYINHVPKGPIWQTPSDWGSVFPSLGAAPKSPDLKLESVSFEWHSEISPRMGRLHVQVQHGITESESKTELLIITLTARGPISHGKVEGVVDVDTGLNLGRATIVKAF